MSLIVLVLTFEVDNITDYPTLEGDCICLPPINIRKFSPVDYHVSQILWQ